MTIRPHGRAKYVHEKCRCDVCGSANRAYSKANNRQRAYGRIQLVDAAPAREHVLQLRCEGMGRRRIATAAGISENAMRKLLDGTPARNMGPSKRIRPETARKILAVQLDLADGANVDATGTHRRLQALVAIGFSQRKLAIRLGLTEKNFSSMMGFAQVTKATAKAVAELYDELWNQPPVPLDHRDRISVSRAKNHANARCWVSPLAWDDDTIDDPAVEPEGVRQASLTYGRKLPEPEDLQFLLDSGESRQSLADRFKVRPSTIDTALARAAA